MKQDDITRELMTIKGNNPELNYNDLFEVVRIKLWEKWGTLRRERTFRKLAEGGNNDLPGPWSRQSVPASTPGKFNHQRFRAWLVMKYFNCPVPFEEPTLAGKYNYPVSTLRKHRICIMFLSPHSVGRIDIDYAFSYLNDFSCSSIDSACYSIESW